MTHGAEPTPDFTVRFVVNKDDLRAAHALFRHRIGPELVEEFTGFRVSATVEAADWLPRLAVAVADGSPLGADAPVAPAGNADGETSSLPSRLIAAQLGGLLPAVAMVSLPYTAVAEGFEGRGVYLTVKRAMLAELRAMAAARGLPPPVANISEEAPGSAQYRRKVEGGIAVALPVAYAQPTALGLPERPLALTYEPLVGPAPAFTAADLRRIVAAVYRGLYRITDPETNPTFVRMFGG
ncbi:MAG: hypothetical protein U0531_20730 [Dehalococcoidia bacterium]